MVWTHPTNKALKVPGWSNHLLLNDECGVNFLTDNCAGNIRREKILGEIAVNQLFYDDLYKYQSKFFII
jgi:hypothetical protein